MNKFLRVFAILAVIILLSTQYQNCSTYNENKLFDSRESSSTLCAEGEDCDWSVGLKMEVDRPNGNLLVSGSESMLQVSGRCTDGFAFDHDISVMLKDRNGFAQTLYLDDVENPIVELHDIKCENGKFFALIPVLTYIDMTSGENFTLHFRMKSVDQDGKIIDEKVFAPVSVVIEDGQS